MYNTCCVSPFRVAFCAEHAHRNALALRAQMHKASSGPSPELLLSQLSGYNRTEMGALGQDGRSEASRILGRQFSRFLKKIITVYHFSTKFVFTILAVSKSLSSLNILYNLHIFLGMIAHGFHGVFSNI